MRWADNLVLYSLNLGAAESLFGTNEQCLYSVRLNYCAYTFVIIVCMYKMVFTPFSLLVAQCVVHSLNILFFCYMNEQCNLFKKIIISAQIFIVQRARK